MLVEKINGKGPLRRPERRWEDNIQMELRETGYENGRRLKLAQDFGISGVECSVAATLV
jgi:hypothetical protein